MPFCQAGCESDSVKTCRSAQAAGRLPTLTVEHPIFLLRHADKGRALGQLF